jgi:nucleotide-binding universal stress UspA family protein
MTALNIDEKVPLVLVVGFDGTEPALRALRSAADVLQQRPGRMDVVFVAHVPSTVALAAQAISAVREGLDTEERDLAKRADEILGDTDVKWRFQRRNGEIAAELLAAGKEELDSEGPSTKVVLVVGGSAHKIDRYLNSTPAKVIRQDRFEVFVVP